MFAIAFDLVVKDTADNNPKGVPAAYAEICATLAENAVIPAGIPGTQMPSMATRDHDKYQYVQRREIGGRVE